MLCKYFVISPLILHALSADLVVLCSGIRKNFLKRIFAEGKAHGNVKKVKNESGVLKTLQFCKQGRFSDIQKVKTAYLVRFKLVQSWFSLFNPGLSLFKLSLAYSNLV